MCWLLVGCGIVCWRNERVFDDVNCDKSLFLLKLDCAIQKIVVKMSKIIVPKEIHIALQQAHAYFNLALFHGKLPKCTISIQRKANSVGYYSHKRFISDTGLYTDEIALNPEYFGVLPVIDTLATLVHEMVHQWQQYYGTVGRRAYHNREWADKMESIGLMPSDTHQPGGKRTGEHMGHYILEDGLFLWAAERLLQTEFSIGWYDVYPPFPPSIGQKITYSSRLNVENKLKTSPALPVEQKLSPAYVPSILKPLPMPTLPIEADDGVNISEETSVSEIIEPLSEPSDHLFDPPQTETLISSYGKPTLNPISVIKSLKQTDTGYQYRNTSNRIKYCCPSCQAAVWGKPELNILCGDCYVHFEAQ